MPSSKDYMEMDDKYCAHNYHPIEVVISKAEGVWVYDPEGKKYLDCLSAYSSHNAGHSHPEIIKTLKEQADIQGLILGSTGLAPILSAKDNTDIPFLDTTRIHAESVVDQLTNGI